MLSSPARAEIKGVNILNLNQNKPNKKTYLHALILLIAAIGTEKTPP